MKLRTSQILAQLSEQDRNKAESALAELHGRKARLSELKQQSLARIRELHLLRDQSSAQPSTASLLQEFELSLREQQTILEMVAQQMMALEEEREQLLSDFAAAFRSQHTYNEMHDRLQRQQRRKQEQKQQRQMDDMVAARRRVARP